MIMIGITLTCTSILICIEILWVLLLVSSLLTMKIDVLSFFVSGIFNMFNTDF